MFEYHEEDDRYYSMHHPFTSPVDEDLPLLERAVEGGETELLGKIRTKAYDPVINGVEDGERLDSYSPARRAAAGVQGAGHDD